MSNQYDTSGNSERKPRSDKGKSRPNYTQKMRKFHAGQRQLKQNMEYLEELRDKESDEENERKLAELLKRPVTKIEDVPRIAEERLQAAIELARKKNEIVGFEKMSKVEKQRAQRHAARQALLPLDRTCKKCKDFKYKSKQWEIYLSQTVPEVCKSCLQLIKQFISELNVEWFDFLEYMIINEVDLLYDCGNIDNRIGCNCVRCSAIKCKETLYGNDDDSASVDKC